jgi:aryl-alcohol dehydrogenase-like predicted oxidoreductase
VWDGQLGRLRGQALPRSAPGGGRFGLHLLDTAWGYGEGRSKRLLGDLVRANPGRRLHTATRIPPKNFQWPTKRGDRLADVFPAEHIREFTEKSLTNLGLPSVDLIQFHVWED